MSKLKFSAMPTPQPRFWAYVTVLLLSMMCLTVQASDYMKQNDKFSMKKFDDHVSFEIFLADLDGVNTYSKSGCICAKDSRGEEHYLLDVRYVEEGSDDNPTGKVKARVCISEARAWFTNGANNQELKITNGSEQEYTLTKWGSKNHYMTAKIDYYYPAELVEKELKFYYRYKHTNGDTYTMNLGTYTLSSSLGLSSFDMSDYECKRIGPDKIKFTAAAMPNDIPSKMADAWRYEGTYIVTFTYKLQNNTEKKVTETFFCEAGNKKSYEITIPEDVGNFKRVDVKFETREGLRDQSNYFWSYKYSYNKNDYFQIVPIPTGLSAEYRQFENAMALQWNTFSNSSDKNYTCLPYVYRIETDDKGNVLSGQSWDQRGIVKNNVGLQAQSFQDQRAQQNTFYKYMVLNVPEEWATGNSISSNDLKNPSDKLLSQLGYKISDVISTSPSLKIYEFTQDTTVTDKVRLTWKYDRVPVSSTTVTFQIHRRQKGSKEWVNYGNVTADANPKPGAVSSFTDSDLPDNLTAYEYKVVLPINDGKNQFESGIVTATLLAGTLVKDMDATKGTHESTVRVTWRTKQAGTGDASYILYRRYAGSNDDFMQIYSTSGHSDNYTFEDNTVQSGYYYEYKVETYSGTTTNENTYQNSLTDIGFCQARGVITGRITFGTGSAVEDVRVSLRPTIESGDNTVSGYSQRIDGLSHGICWEADSTSLAKIFGDGKDFTVQMFVRPDSSLVRGAVIGNIPGVGQLMIGDVIDGNYPLLCKQVDAVTTNKVFNRINHFRAIYYNRNISANSSTDNYTVYTFSNYETIKQQWQNEGFTYMEDWDATWVSPSSSLVVLYGKTEEIPTPVAFSSTEGNINYYDLGISIPAGVYSLLTVKREGQNVVISVNDSTKTGMTLADTEPFSDSTQADNGYYIYNGNPLSFEGTLVPTLQGSAWMYNSFIENTGINDYLYGMSPLYKQMNFAVGGGEFLEEGKAFKGNITEVRVFDRSLTKEALKSYADRMLTGRELGLRLYWPMDEGIDHLVFDASYSNDVPNGHHATVGTNISSSTIVPNEHQLSRYAITNEEGEYNIRGIPFVGSGTSYSILPSKGIHTFSPNTRNGFIGNGSMVLNSMDFTDNSSFPLRGKVTYLNTNIPADSIQFKIDGNLVQSIDGVMSDANGNYEISVPIGNHRIEAYRNGHRLTSFPDNGTTYDFHQAEIVNFFDSTLVNVTGRINGGFSDQDEPLGFRRSVNRLGRATIKLSLGKEKDCSFNYLVDNNGSGGFGSQPIPVNSATTEIHSTAYRAGKETNNDDTHYIYITTDEETGEFSALLPPLQYKVESITFEGGKDYDDLPVFSQNLPLINATNTIPEAIKKDSLSVNGTTTEYEYVAKFVRQYRATPTITVVQTGMENGAYGEIKIPVGDANAANDSIEVVRLTDTGCQYVYDHPIFMQEGFYEMLISVSEDYKNLDTGELFAEVPEDAVVNISNEASASTTVYGETVKIGNEEVAVGEAYEVCNIKVTPNADGLVLYRWVGGWPNLGSGHLRNLSISTTIDGRTTMWHAPDSESDALDLYLLGSICTGTNFVTQGPDHVDMILRRPPGSTSSATLQNDKIYTTSYMEANTTKEASFGGGVYISMAPTVEVEQGVVTALAILNGSKYKGIFNTTQYAEGKWTDWDIEKEADTYSLSELIKTPTSGGYIQNNGDTYIGRSTNLQFGKGTKLGLFRQSDGNYKIDTKETITVGESFGTYFAYPQKYIEKVLIPNWQALIDNMLTHVEGNHWEESVAVREPGRVMYYTKYNKGDPEWGTGNADRDVWTLEQMEATGYSPSYKIVNGTDEEITDTLELYINQIKVWKQTIANNEKDKLDAFESSDNSYLIDNYSIAGGTSISQTQKTQHSHDHIMKTEYSMAYNGELKEGLMVNEVGGYAFLKWSAGKKENTESDSTTVTSKTVAWTMSDGDSSTALSVDVFNSPTGWGPIFRTRGGQTANPYEDATYTHYYNKGTKLDEATMRVEKPALRVKGSNQLTDVPTGGEARFTLELINESETKNSCTYVLEAIENSNTQGAILMIDGSPLSFGRTGRSIKLGTDETLEKLLIVTQSDRSVTDYDGIRLVLRSSNDSSTHSDTVSLYVHFVPASAKVELKVDHTVLNLVDEAKYGGVKTTLFNLDRQDSGLKGLRVQYRRKGIDSWSLAHQWRVNEEDLMEGDELLPSSGSSVQCVVKFPSDGIYELRGQSFGLYGNEEVTYETEIIEIVQDTRGPKMLGMPSPENGLLSYFNRNNMHVRYNEPLNTNALSKSGNFRIDGYMNNILLKGQYTDVAVQLNGEEIQTEAMYDLSNSNWAFDFWLYRQSDGSILTLGSEDNMLSLYTHDDGKLAVRLGDSATTKETNTVLPADKWIYMAMNYKQKDDDDMVNHISLLYVDADMDQPEYFNSAADAITAHGHLSIGGDGMTGMMHDMTFWNSEITATELYERKDESKAAYTPGLIGYWRMDEGHGTTLTDKARSRNMLMDTESWYINNKNKAAHLDGTEPFRVDISTFNLSETDNFAIELWFRLEWNLANFSAQLLSCLNGFSIGFDDGKMVLQKSIREVNSDNTENKVVTEQTLLTDVNYFDNNWHHLALNVRRGTSAIVYIDGQAVKTLPVNTIPGVSGKYLCVGGEQTLTAPDGSNADGSVNCFVGDIDEVRIWSTALMSDMIAERRFERLDSACTALVGYFPMENIHRTMTGTVTTDFSTENFGCKEYVSLTATSNATESLTAPALLPGSRMMRLDDTEFDFTASNDEIYFSFPDDALPLMDGNEFVVTIDNIKDEHGNPSETVQWKFRADFASLDWETENLEIEKQWDEEIVFHNRILNQAGQTQSYEITGMPTWMSIDQPIGISNGDVPLTFTITPTVPVGKYTRYLYLSDNLGIKRVFKISLTVKGDEPGWAVNPNLYESNMSLTGQIYIGDKISDFTDSKLAAFDELGQCRGVGQPKYVKSRDAYYVDMIIYGASATEISTGVRDLTFKMFDASTGILHPVVNITLPDGTIGNTLQYAPDANYGSYDYPVVFRATNDLQQTVSLPRGWTWMSVYVNPTSPAIGDVLPSNNSELKKYMNIKSKNDFATSASDGSAVVGSLQEITPGNMYKIQVSANTELIVIGSSINLSTSPITIYPGFNWIGSLSASVMSPEEAFADLMPEKDDMVKSRNASAYYNGNGVWEGTLQNIVPGEGYIYLSKAAEAKTFRFPRITSGLQTPWAAPSRLVVSNDWHYQPLDDHLFPDNMNIIAVVEKDGQRIENAEVAAFINNECRSAETCLNGYYFLTIMGSSADDIDKVIELRVFVDDEEYIFEIDRTFISDAMIGTLEEPYVLNVNEVNGIRDINADDTDDMEWYTLQGFKIGRRPTQPGVYIHGNKKVTVSTHSPHRLSAE